MVMKKLSESEKEELRKKVFDYHAQNLEDIARDADQQGEFFAQERKGIRKGVVGGLAMMAIAVVWSVVAWNFGYVFYYTPVLFIIGLYAFIKGMITGNIAGKPEDLPSSESRGVKILAIVIVLAVLVFAGLWIINTITSPKSEEWREFNSSEGGFSVLLPGKATSKIETANTMFGPIDTHVFLLVRKNAIYGVTYYEYPAILAQASTPDAILDKVINNIKAKGKLFGESIKARGKLIEESIISLNGYPGRELKIELEPEESDVLVAMKTRVFMIDSKICRVTVVTPNGSIVSEDAMKFLDSFKVSE
jgi:hypothetical protein